jgi:hypothetical protein
MKAAWRLVLPWIRAGFMYRQSVVREVEDGLLLKHGRVAQTFECLLATPPISCERRLERATGGLHTQSG